MSRGPRDQGDALGGEQVEGRHAVRQLLLARRRRVKRLWVADSGSVGDDMVEIVRLAQQLKVPLQRRGPEAMAAAAQTSAPQGVIAWAEPVVGAALGDLVAEPLAFLVVLDGVTDPGNFGSILRTAACAGVTGVVVGRHRSAPLTPAAVKAAAGAVEHVPIAVVPGVPAALAQLGKAALWTVGLDAAAEDSLWSLAVLSGPVALVLGSEGRGLSGLARRRCDVLARIEQWGPLGSLNVAVAAGVACFEVARRRTGGT